MIQHQMIAVTGANGFVGRALCAEAVARSFNVRGLTRAPCCLPDGVKGYVLASMDENTDWQSPLTGSNVVVHLAARVHVMQDAATDPLAEFRRVNVQGTLNLARQAALAGVRRFVFVSSIKVNGESTKPFRPFTEDDNPAPVDPYGVSKMEAERGLRNIALETGMEVVIIRPPLVYGPGVKANFQTMMKWLAKGVPLPLGAVDNRRSLVSIDNLVDLIVTCVEHPAAANETFLVSDGEDLSTTQLLRRLSLALGKPTRLVPFPLALLTLGAACLGRASVVQRLCGSLQVDITKTKAFLGWVPPLSVDEGLKRAAEGHLREASV